MRKYLLVLISLALILTSCGVRKSYPRHYSHRNPKTAENLKSLKSNFRGEASSHKASNIVKTAEKFIGTPYQYGRKSSTGTDCSGLVIQVFSQNNVSLPRRSQDQANSGRAIKVSDIRPGDLLFFATGGGNRVSHVGIVHDINSDGDIYFIHASTSRGVILSSLKESYWNQAFLFARRVL